ncbi:MAG: GNAT family N-acetyltransferase [Lachnospiraceae bacterium]|nr:GNAT family N-acetyltransferase [Lachnospiraceae bacterium]
MELTKVDRPHLRAFMEVIDETQAGKDDLVIAALSNKRAAGAVVYSLVPDTDTLRLKYLFVKEVYRRQGVGRTLVLEVAKKLEAGGILVTFPDDAEDVYGFLSNIGFVLVKDSDRFSIGISELSASKAAKRIMEGRASANSITIDMLSGQDKEILEKKISEAGARVDLSDTRGLYAPLSLVLTDDKTNEPKACVLCSRYEEDIVVEYMFSESDNPLTISALLKEFYQAAKKEGLLNATLSFVTERSSIKRLLNALADKDIQPAGAMINGLR